MDDREADLEAASVPAGALPLSMRKREETEVSDEVEEK